jgi:hypothetical protein
VLEQHLVGNVWFVFDANSGRHVTQLHARSIAGFVIVNPHEIRARRIRPKVNLSY